VVSLSTKRNPNQYSQRNDKMYVLLNKRCSEHYKPAITEDMLANALEMKAYEILYNRAYGALFAKFTLSKAMDVALESFDLFETGVMKDNLRKGFQRWRQRGEKV
jgi:hypothetical protein